MSRPPRPESPQPLRTELTPRAGGLDYLPLDFDALVALAAGVGGPLPPDARDPTATLYQLSALVAHVLAVHQDHVAGEAFLGTAVTARSLVKHGRRLGYEPAPGSTATGFLVAEVKPGLSGVLPAGLAAATSPSGGAAAQEFETASARRVDASWNRLSVRAADRIAVEPLAATDRTLRVAGTGHGFRAGEPAILTGPGHWIRIDLAGVVERDGVTELTLAAPLGIAVAAPGDPADYTVWSRPGVDARLFGWNADPALFPPDRLETAVGYTAPGTVDENTLVHGYRVTSPSGAATAATTELFLAAPVAESLIGRPVLVVKPGSDAVVTIGATDADQVDVAVAFVRGGSRQVVTAVNPSTGTPTLSWVLDERAHRATVTRLRAVDRTGAAQTRAAIGVHSRLVGHWRASAPLVGRRPSALLVRADHDVHLEGQHPGLEPGMLAALRSLDGSRAQVVELYEVEVDPAGNATRLRYKERTEIPRHPDGTRHDFTLGDVELCANVVPIVHGVVREEVIGESDGVAPFQRHKLKKAPLAHVPSGDGVSPDLEVRVGGVRWQRVTDFGVPAPDPTARHYKLERDHDGTTWVRFADGRAAAVPPGGRNNLTVRYRVGLGTEGNVDAGRINRLMKSHPLLERVGNPVATGGGTAPAGAEDVRRQATRYIRTFDRAVSIRDHADLALLFPGVARATARLVGGTIELVAATAEGKPVPNRELLLEFLDARRDDALRLVPVDPVAVGVTIRVYVEVDPAFLVREVEASVRAAFLGTDAAAPGLFTFAARDLGQAAHASEVHAALARVPGVTFGQLVAFDLTPNTGLRDVLVPRPHQWLRLDATALTFAPPGEGDHD